MHIVCKLTSHAQIVSCKRCLHRRHTEQAIIMCAMYKLTSGNDLL